MSHSRIMLLFLLTLTLGVDAKQVTNAVQLGGPKAERRYEFAAKFGVAPAGGSYAVRFKIREIQSPSNIELSVFVNSQWDAIATKDALQACSPEGRNMPRDTQAVLLDEGGTWSPWLNGSLRSMGQPYIVYFALSSCDENFDRRRVQFELRALQFDSCHFSFEFRYMLGIYIWILAMQVAFGVYFACRTYLFCRRLESFHPVLMVLGAAIVVQCMAEGINLCNLLVYSLDGKGMKPIEMMSEVMLMLAQVLVSSIFLVIGIGYTLVPWKADDLESVAAMIACIFAIHSCLVSLGHVEEEQHDKHHQNDGLIGYAILAIRLGIYAFFMRGVWKTKQACGLQTQAFLDKFVVLGSVFFLALPGLFLVVHALPYHHHHPVMQIGSMIIQCTAIAGLSHLFFSRGEYFKLSTLSASMLTGGPHTSVAKGD